MSGQNPNQRDPAVPVGARAVEPTSTSSAAPGDLEGEQQTPSGAESADLRDELSDQSGADVVEVDDDDLLTVSSEDLELPPPVLGEAKISSDVAAEASLDEVVAEARSVEQEAQEAGTLAGGRLPGDPTSPNEKSDDAVAKKIEAAAQKAKADLANKASARDPAASPPSPDHEASSNVGTGADARPDTASSRSAETGKGGDDAPQRPKGSGEDQATAGTRHNERKKESGSSSAESADGEYEDDSVDESGGSDVEEYPSAPDADENPQEPVSEPEATSPEPDDTSAGPRDPSHEDESDTAEQAESYPATPDGSKESKPRRGKGDGPGAAKISDPHERDYPERRRGRRAVDPPVAPERPPGSEQAGSQQPDGQQADSENAGAAQSGADQAGRYGQPGAEEQPGGATDQPSGAPGWPASFPAAQQQCQPPSSWEGQISAAPVSVRERPKKSKAPLFIGLGIALALVLGVVLLIMALTSFFSIGSSEGQPSVENAVIAENVSPFDFRQGQCFTDFTDATQPATVVNCNSPHEAQLVNTFIYEDDAEFPGEEALINRADELCRSTQLNDAAQNYELRQQTAYPQPESWAQGDRRVDCFIRVPDGGLTESLID